MIFGRCRSTFGSGIWRENWVCVCLVGEKIDVVETEALGFRKKREVISVKLGEIEPSQWQWQWQ